LNYLQSDKIRNGKWKSWTTEWMVRRIKDQREEIAVRDLTKFAKKGRRQEVTRELIKLLNQADERQTQWYIDNLHNAPRTIQAMGKNQIDLTGVVTTYLRHL